MKKCRVCGVEKDLVQFSKHPTAAQGVRPECKPCRAAITRKWRENNPELVRRIQRDATKKWRAAHPERHAASYAKQNAKMAERRLADPEGVRAADRARWARYYATDRGWNVYALGWQRRRARLLAAYVEDTPFEAVLLRDLGVCGICQRQITSNQIDMDHVIPLAAGGTHEMKNIQLAHPACNKRKGARANFTLTDAARP